MRSVNFSKDSLPIQYQYLKRNLRELGILANFGDFESKAHRAIKKIIQDGIHEEFDAQNRCS